MESLSRGLSAFPPLLSSPRTPNSSSTSILTIPKTHNPISGIPVCQSSKIDQNPSFLNVKNEIFLGTNVSFFSMGFFLPLSCFASESDILTDGEVSNKINLEAVVVSIDEFFNKNPFFVAGVAFIWLFVVPLVQANLRKYKFVAAIDAFRKLRDDPTCQLVDIRDKKSLEFLNTPNLTMLKKSALQAEFKEGDEDGFVKNVLRNFKEPESTSICILDSFDGKSMKVAELLVKSGFKEAYAVKGGIIGKKGWQEIQETLLPPSVHIKAKKKDRVSQELEAVDAGNKDSGPHSADNGSLAGKIEEMVNGSIKTVSELKSGSESVPRSSSPYPNYPDLKPPSSPTPLKPER